MSKKAAPPARCILTYNRDTKKVSVSFENFDGVPTIALDRVDVLIEQALWHFRASERRAAAETSRKEMQS